MYTVSRPPGLITPSRRKGNLYDNGLSLSRAVHARHSRGTSVNFHDPNGRPPSRPDLDHPRPEAGSAESRIVFLHSSLSTAVLQLAPSVDNPVRDVALSIKFIFAVPHAPGVVLSTISFFQAHGSVRASDVWVIALRS